MLRRQGYNGRGDNDRQRTQFLPYRSAEPFQGLSRRQRARRVDPVAAARILSRPARLKHVTNTGVTAIDPKANQVTLSDGGSLGYGALLLATGAEPVHLKIPGAELPHVCYLRTLDDSRRIIAKAKNANRAVVIGSSFIGLEVAWSLRERKLEVARRWEGTIPAPGSSGKGNGQSGSQNARSA